MTSYQPFHVPLKEAARILGYCTRTLYNMEAAGELKFFKKRRRTFVPVTELDRIKAELEAASSSDAATEQSPAPAPQPEPNKRPRVKKRKLYPRE